MTQTQQKQKLEQLSYYEDTHMLACPNCGSTSFSYGDPVVSFDSRRIGLPIKCNQCKSRFEVALKASQGRAFVGLKEVADE